MNEIQTIRAAADGLYYISETDSGFEVHEVKGEGSTEAQLRSMLGRDASDRVEQQELAYFFRNMTRTYEGAGAEDEERAAKFRRLQEVLESNLSGISVFRFGEVMIDAVITGMTKSGQQLAVKVKLVET